MLFPVAGSLLALTTALAAACFVKAFGISFLAFPRSREAGEARESPAVMLAPQAFLAVLCVALGLFPGTVVQVLGPVVAALGQQAPSALAHGPLVLTPGPAAFDHIAPLALALALIAGLAAGAPAVLRVALARRATRPRAPIVRVPTWGCGGTLGPQTEYTATAFSKPLMMIFKAIYRPSRRVEAPEISPYFTREVRYRAEIEPTFERYMYAPLMRGVLTVAERMKVLQAGSLHAYLGYVIALVLTLVLFVWWTG